MSDTMLRLHPQCNVRMVIDTKSGIFEVLTANIWHAHQLGLVTRYQLLHTVLDAGTVASPCLGTELRHRVVAPSCMLQHSGNCSISCIMSQGRYDQLLLANVVYAR